MNPFGAAVPFRAGNGQYDAEDPPHVSKIIHGVWNVVYCWPPPSTLTRFPRVIEFTSPSKLESALFGCRCREEIAEKLTPIKVFAEKAEVQACELINEERQVEDALDLSKCECRPVPLGDKIAVLPVNEDVLLHYQRVTGVTYSRSQPNTCLLLYKYLPSSLEMEHLLRGLDVDRRHGDVTFMIKQE